MALDLAGVREQGLPRVAERVQVISGQQAGDDRRGKANEGRGAMRGDDDRSHPADGEQAFEAEIEHADALGQDFS